MSEPKEPGPAPKGTMIPGWAEECIRFHGRVLAGVLSHECADWDGLPIDETCDEMVACTCDKWEITRQALEAREAEKATR